MAGRWRVWLPGRRAVPPASPQSDPFTAPANPATEADALSRLLDEIQAVALAVYDQHGLPTRLEQLSPTRRFELMLEHPAEQGWRFARLEDLGARHRDHPEVEVASELLNAVSRLRRNRGSASADDLAEAIRLGQIWRTLTAPRTVEPEIAAETVAPPHTPLTLQPPERPKRRRRR
jgi:hypothetical protein